MPNKLKHRLQTGRILISLIVLLIILIGCAKLNEPTSENDHLLVDRIYGTYGYARDAYISDEYIYVAEDNCGFSIFDRVTGERMCNFQDYVSFEKMRLIYPIESENLLFVYNKYGSNTGITSFDISDIEDPQFQITIAGETSDVTDLKCLLRSSDEVDIFWANDNSINYRNFNSGSTAAYNFGNPVNGFDEDEDYYFVAVDQIGLSIMEKSTSQIIYDFNLPGRALDLKINENFAYVASREEGLHIINIADKLNPELIFSYDTSGLAQSVDVFDDYVILASGGGGVYVFDISDANSPEFYDRIDDEEIGYSYKVTCGAGYIFASTRYGVIKLKIKK